MEVNGRRRTQAERTAATRAVLIDAARALFAEQGFANVSTQAIAAAAGVTRGALYHQFADKTALFTAVYEDVERTVERLHSSTHRTSPPVTVDTAPER